MWGHVKVLAFSACVGATYGAAGGAPLGALLGYYVTKQWDQAAVCGRFGLVLGAGGGLLGGALGAWVRGRLAWGLAGVAGGVAAGLALLANLVLDQGYDITVYGWLILTMVPGVIGALAGGAVGDGARRERTVLPGVSALGAAVRQVDAQRAARRRDRAFEVTPATPTGRRQVGATEPPGLFGR